MKKPIVLYIVITIICVIALVMGVYYQFFKQDATNVGQENVLPDKSSQEEEETQEEIKSKFNELFTNKLDKKGYNTDNIEKVDSSKEIIYPITMVQNQASYEMDLNIPVFNIKGDVATEFNNTTQQTFINKANQIMAGSGSSTQNNQTNNEITIDTSANTRVLYDISYQAYINGNILSVVIKSSLKEGNNPQRVIIQTYNYNLVTKRSIELTDVIEPYGLTKDEINAKVQEVTTEASKQEEVLTNAGYETYKRDLESPIYDIENMHNFFLGANGELYIIFAYGNNNYTSEMDIIKMDTYPQVSQNENTNNTETTENSTSNEITTTNEQEDTNNQEDSNTQNVSQ